MEFTCTNCGHPVSDGAHCRICRPRTVEPVKVKPDAEPLLDLAADLARSRTRRNEIDMSGIAVDYARRYQALREKYAKLSKILHEAHEPMWLVAVPEAATWHECKRDSCKLAQAMLAEVEGLA